jgi:hypothetical protein
VNRQKTNAASGGSVANHSTAFEWWLCPS